jgi:hypothetical protein
MGIKPPQQDLFLFRQLENIRFLSGAGHYAWY